MRKQYHFRQSERGLLAWDVDQLAELTKNLPRIQVPLTAIRELDEPYWFSSGNHEATCRAVVEHAQFIAEADLAFPIILSSDGSVMDGMHRVGKALLSGLTSIEAVQFESDPAPDHIGIEPEDLPYETHASGSPGDNSAQSRASS
jgi:hypothetical protein